jgi:hypothetical protein
MVNEIKGGIRKEDIRNGVPHIPGRCTAFESVIILSV